MAAKKLTEKTLERTYNVPLRQGTRNAPNWRRTKKAVSVLREFLAQHMKSENVKISKAVNEKLWEHGIKNPPHHIKVTVTKDEKGMAYAKLFGEKEPVKAKETKKAPARKTPAQEPEKKVEAAPTEA